jgi:hypothetical protein
MDHASGPYELIPAVFDETNKLTYTNDLKMIPGTELRHESRASRSGRRKNVALSSPLELKEKTEPVGKTLERVIVELE